VKTILLKDKLKQRLYQGITVQSWRDYLKLYKNVNGILLISAIASIGQTLLVVPAIFLINYIFELAFPVTTTNSLKILNKDKVECTLPEWLIKHFLEITVTTNKTSQITLTH